MKDFFLPAPIEGGYNLKSREIVCAKMVQHPEVSGYFLDGFHANGATAMALQIDEIGPIVSRCMELLPGEKVKMMLGAYSPLITVELCRLGVDLFDNSYAYLASVRAVALTFSTDWEKTAGDENVPTFDMDLSSVE